MALALTQVDGMPLFEVVVSPDADPYLELRNAAGDVLFTTRQ